MSEPPADLDDQLDTDLDDPPPDGAAAEDAADTEARSSLDEGAAVEDGTTADDGGVPDDGGERDGGAGPPTAAGSLLGDATLADLVVAAAALFLLIANAPGQLRGGPVLMAMVALPLGAVGLVNLGILAVRGDAPARWGSAFVVWAALATIASDQPARAFDAGWGADQGLVYFAAYVGCWAIGRRRGAAAARLVTGALLVGLAGNVLLSLFQAISPSSSGLVALYDGRVMGFSGNPVLVGALMAGGVALCASLAGRGGSRWPAWLLGVGAFAMVVNLSGSRVSLGAALVLGPLAAWTGGRRWPRAAAVLAVVLAGMVLGGAILSNPATGRLDDQGGASGMGPRLIMWDAGLEAIAERPVLGWGPNRFRAATNPRTTAEFSRRMGDDDTYDDAHNALVEIGVATGVPGLLLAGGFVVAATRRARGPLAWYAAGVAASWLLQPLAVATLPTAMLALGLAAPRQRDGTVDPPIGAPAARAATAGVAVLLAGAAFVSAGRYVLVDRILYDVYEVSDPRARAADAYELVPDDPLVHGLYSRLTTEDATLFPELELGPRAIEVAQEGVDLDPELWFAWVDLGIARQRFTEGSNEERFTAARPAYLRAQEISPWSRVALIALYRTDRALGRDDDAARWRSMLCELDACPPE